MFKYFVHKKPKNVAKNMLEITKYTLSSLENYQNLQKNRTHNFSHMS